MTRAELIEQIKSKESFLCVGLDTDLNKIPAHLLNFEDPIFEFNKRIIDATKDYAVAYKPNIAFYESMGIDGWKSLAKTLAYIPENIFTIADAKRGDIGNTSEMYAKTFFQTYPFDSVTVAPYMGEDSVTPFLNFDGKWVILLALTSNKGGKDFQELMIGEDTLYEKVLEKSQTWGNEENLMYVVGATRGEDIGRVRAKVPNAFFLVPGVGKQGGSLDDVVKFGMNKDCGLLVNSSRGIIYAGEGENFTEAVTLEAKKIQEEMQQHLKNYNLI